MYGESIKPFSGNSSGRARYRVAPPGYYTRVDSNLSETDSNLMKQDAYINNLEVKVEQLTQAIHASEDLEEFLMNDDFDEVNGDFLELNDLLSEDEIDPFGAHSESEEEPEMGMSLDDFSDELENILESLIPKAAYNRTDDELIEKEIKQMEAVDQAIQTILMGLPEDIYAAVDSCKNAQEIWFTSTDGELIEFYYHRFSKLMDDFKRNKHFPEKIANNLKFLNNLQPEWRRHVEVNEPRAERLAKTHDPLALMANSNNPYNYLVFHPDKSSPITYTSTTSMNMALVLMAKAFKLNYSTPTSNNQRISSTPYNRQIAQPCMNMGQDRQMQMVGVQNVRNQANANQNRNGNVVATRAKGNGTGNNKNQVRCYNCRGMGHLARNCIVRPRRRDAA
ncbi:isoflavone 3'-hydroxylase-like protein [Tanacetum coccineum]